MGDYFTKHHPPHHRRYICATYLYLANVLLAINHKILHEWYNAVLTPIHMVAITQNRTVVQGFANAVSTDVQAYTTTVT